MGALARDGGVNFAVFSDHASRIELCVFDAEGTRELRRYNLHGPAHGMHHGWLADVGPGLVYGLRAHGVHAPDAGQRFNPHKLLLDPCAREIVGRFRWLPEHHGYPLGHPDGLRALDTRDNAVSALKARVSPPPGSAAPIPAAPPIADAQRVLYEVHVKGFSRNHPDLPAALRGTYAGLAHPLSIAHFKRLGVNTMSLLPVQYALDEPGLAERGLSNYWGYNTLGHFCPDPRWACPGADPGAVREEFRAMVGALHAAGIQLVLDVVHNHTPEGNEYGPTLSFRGLDQSSWYRLGADGQCLNWSGCGNTLNVAHPRVAQFVLDSLRYWVSEMGVDGFRFDLAPVLDRAAHGAFDAHGNFFAALRQDPLLQGVLLLAEPWDSGPQGYQLGHFPGRFAEWNDRFRDTARRYWLQPGKGVGRGEFARRFFASSDVYQHGQRRPTASVNFISAHDGFTLLDQVSYSAKRNTANGEDNRDGRDNEIAIDCGVPGPSRDAQVLAQRGRLRRALLATLALAQGMPMLCAGDEIGKTQGGNNNAWCHDNATSWLDWNTADNALCTFVADCLALRRAQPLLHHADWFRPGQGAQQLRWLRPDGQDMQVDDWHDAQSQALACLMTDHRAPGQRLLLAFNPEPEALKFQLGAPAFQVALDSSGSLSVGSAVQGSLTVPAQCLLVLSLLSNP